jgi:hypothetical protein
MKNSLFAFFLVLFSMCFFRVVDDDGSGADIEDFDIDDIDDDKDKDQEEEKIEKVDDPPDDDSDAIEELKAFKNEIENERAIVTATNELVAKHSDFDITKIAEKIKGMEPDEQEKFNNPLGWELLHLQHFQKRAVEFDPFDTGRGASKEPFDFDGAYEKLGKGDRSIVADLIANSR